MRHSPGEGFCPGEVYDEVNMRHSPGEGSVLVRYMIRRT